MATILRANGTTEEVVPKNKRLGFHLDYVRDVVGGYVQAVSLSRKEIMLMNEEGKLLNLPVNVEATLLYKSKTGIADYIHGDVIVCTNKEFK